MKGKIGLLAGVALIAMFVAIVPGASADHENFRCTNDTDNPNDIVLFDQSVSGFQIKLGLYHYSQMKSTSTSNTEECRYGSTTGTPDYNLYGGCTNCGPITTQYGTLYINHITTKLHLIP